jgi:pyruvate dehydrogenase (quinone)
MGMNASDVLVETLLEWGVNVIFGLPGDGINGIMEALRVRQDKIRFIQVRHEESAACMACAYAKYTGKLGVCLATSGPGGIHLLNGLYDAKLDGQSVLAITGLQFHDLVNTHTQQDVELDKLFMDVAVYNNRIMGPAHVENVTSMACRAALSYHGVAHITMPVDMQTLPAVKGSKRNVPHHVSEVFAAPARVPSSRDVEQAAKILNEGKKIAILAGRGALAAGRELIAVAQLLEAPIIKALLGKAAVPDDHSYTTGGIGLLGTLPSQEAMETCDTLLIVGASFPYIEYYPKPGQARIVQIDRDPLRVGLRCPVEVGLVGDCQSTLNMLLPLLEKRTNRDFIEKAQSGMKQWRALMEQRGTRTDVPMKPQVVAWELGKRLPTNAIVSSDSGTITTWWARQISSKEGQMHSCSGNLASMACALPYTLAAQIAYPDRPCFAFIGDGGFSMLMADFVTAVKYKLPIRVVVIKNSTLGQIKWEQIVFLGNPEYGVDLAPIDFVMFAKACGAQAFRIEDPTQCGAILDEALAVQGPVLIEAVVDPFEPPMPSRIEFEQAKHFTESLVRGEPNGYLIALTAAKNMVRELV